MTAQPLYSNTRYKDALTIAQCKYTEGQKLDGLFESRNMLLYRTNIPEKVQQMRAKLLTAIVEHANLLPETARKLIRIDKEEPLTIDTLTALHRNRNTPDDVREEMKSNGLVLLVRI